MPIYHDRHQRPQSALSQHSRRSGRTATLTQKQHHLHRHHQHHQHHHHQQQQQQKQHAGGECEVEVNAANSVGEGDVGASTQGRVGCAINVSDIAHEATNFNLTL